MKMLKMCLNPKVLAGLAAVGVGIYLVAPDLVVAALPILLLAACPLSMVLIMWSMPHTQEQHPLQEPNVGLSGEERIARLRAQLGALEQEEAHPAENRRGRIGA